MWSSLFLSLVAFATGAPPEHDARYEALVMTYGCNSSAEVAELERIRSDPKAFQKLLLTQIAYGQCIGIGKGTVVDGVLEHGESSILRIEARSSPPGYMAPAGDFRQMQE
jgi:hypothetical protein